MPSLRKPKTVVPPSRVLLVTGMSGAGKSSVLKALEDLGYEAVDNLPISLLTRLLATQDARSEFPADRPLAIGIDTRTRAFDSEKIVRQLKSLRQEKALDVRVLFLDCAGEELARRFSETRRRHPLAQDRPVMDGIARERELLAPLRRWADVLLDTTDHTIHQLRRAIADRFSLSRSDALTITIMSFGFARGVPRDADLVFDLRFLSNPHWIDHLRPLTGLDNAVATYVETDSAFQEAFERLEGLLEFLIPNYRREGKSYLTIAFGCTGGKHRSVFVAERMGAVLKSHNHALTIVHRDLSVQIHGAEQSMREPPENKTI